MVAEMGCQVLQVSSRGSQLAASLMPLLTPQQPSPPPSTRALHANITIAESIFLLHLQSYYREENHQGDA